MTKKKKVIIGLLSVVLSLTLLFGVVSFFALNKNNDIQITTSSNNGDSEDNVPNYLIKLEKGDALKNTEVSSENKETFNLLGGIIDCKQFDIKDDIVGSLVSEYYNNVDYDAAVYIGDGCSFSMSESKIINYSGKQGAIYVANGGTCIINSGEIENSFTSSEGGAIYVESGGHLIIRNLSLKNCGIIKTTQNKKEILSFEGNAIYVEKDAYVTFGEENSNYVWNNSYNKYYKQGFGVSNCGELTGEHIKFESTPKVEYVKNLPILTEIEVLNDEEGKNKFYKHIDWDLKVDIDDNYDYMINNYNYINKEVCCGYFMDTALIKSSKNMETFRQYFYEHSDYGVLAKLWTMRADPNNFTFIELASTGKYLVKSKNTELAGDIAIPEKYKNKDVEGLFFSDVGFVQTGANEDNYKQEYADYISSAFKNCSNITRVGMPATIKNISRYAFYRCTNLKEINLHDRLTGIGSDTVFSFAFRDCSSLTYISIPKSLEVVSRGAFYNCPLEEIVVPVDHEYFVHFSDNLALVNKNRIDSDHPIGFLREKSLIAPTIYINNLFEYDEVINSITTYTFSPRLGLSEINFPKGLETIGSCAVYNCGGVEKITFHEDNIKLRAIGSAAFGGTAISEITIPNTVERVDYYCFLNCKNLEKVIMSEGVTKLNRYTFANCVNLKNIYCNGVEDLDSNAFSGCSGLIEIQMNSLTSLDNLNILSNNKESLKKIKLNGVRFIPEKLFYEFKSLETIEINNAEEIGVKAFYGCESLTDISMQNVQKINGMAFAWCSKLCSLISHEISNDITMLPKAVYVGNYAFQGCSSLPDVGLGEKSFEYLGYGAFQGCNQLEAASLGFVKDDSIETVIDSNAFYGCEILRVAYIENVKVVGDKAFAECSSLESVHIKNVKVIGDKAFNNCSVLEKLSVDGTLDNLVELGGYAFSLTNIKSIELPMVENIGSYAFYYCEELTSVKMPKVKNLGAYAFAECSSLGQVFIDRDEKNGFEITDIGEYAFKNCSNLDFTAGTNLNKNYLRFEFLNKINDGVFYGCSSIESIDITLPQVNTPTVVDNIPVSSKIGNYAFYGCTGLKDVKISSCYEVGEGSFKGCSSLNFGNTEIYTSSFINNILKFNKESFYGCEALGGVYFENAKYIGESAFEGCINLFGINGISLIPPVQGIIFNNVEICNYAFKGCSSLKAVKVVGGNYSSLAFDDNVTIVS